MAKMKGVLTSVLVLSAFSAEFDDRQTGRSVEYFQLHGYQSETREFLKIKLKRDQLSMVDVFIGQVCDIEVETDTTAKGNPLLCRIQSSKAVKAA